jgi:hypothetical protein
MIPPSDGYQWIRRPSEFDLPPAPDWMIAGLLAGRNCNQKTAKLIRQASGQRRHYIRDSPAPVSTKERFRVFRNLDFRRTWLKNRPMPQDQTNSAYEFSIA